MMIASGALVQIVPRPALDSNESFWLEDYAFTTPRPLARFHADNHSQQAMIGGGVYALFYHHPNGCLDLRYVGQVPPGRASGRRTGFKPDLNGLQPDFSHPAVLKLMRETGCIAARVHIAWHVEPDAQYRARIRRRLVEAHRPAYNHPSSRTQAFISSLLSLAQHQPFHPTVL